MDYTYTFLGNDFSTAENCKNFIEKHNLISGINKLRLKYINYEIYVNEDGKIDCRYENDRYLPAIKQECVYRPTKFYDLLYIFNNQIINNYPARIGSYCSTVYMHIMMDGVISHIIFSKTSCEYI